MSVLIESLPSGCYVGSTYKELERIPVLFEFHAADKPCLDPVKTPTTARVSHNTSTHTYALDTTIATICSDLKVTHVVIDGQLTSPYMYASSALTLKQVLGVYGTPSIGCVAGPACVSNTMYKVRCPTLAATSIDLTLYHNVIKMLQTQGPSTILKYAYESTLLTFKNRSFVVSPVSSSHVNVIANNGETLMVKGALAMVKGSHVKRPTYFAVKAFYALAERMSFTAAEQAKVKEELTTERLQATLPLLLGAHYFEKECPLSKVDSAIVAENAAAYIQTQFS